MIGSFVSFLVIGLFGSFFTSFARFFDEKKNKHVLAKDIFLILMAPLFLWIHLFLHLLYLFLELSFLNILPQDPKWLPQFT